MFKFLLRFAKEDAGAVTVDWVVLTAGIVALNVFIIINLIEDGIEQNAYHINDKIDEASSVIE